MKRGFFATLASARALLDRRRTRVALSVCVVVIAALIFFFSSQDGPTSTRMSSGIVSAIVRLFVRDYDAMSAAERRALWRNISLFVRKGAHFLEYAALGFFLRLLLLASRLSLRRSGPIAWLGGALYAASDEFHQTFTAARGGMWQDVVLDSAGVLFGCLAALALISVIVLLRRKRKAE